jgi:hypothetical protein
MTICLVLWLFHNDKLHFQGSKCSDVDFGHNEVRKTVGVTEVGIILSLQYVITGFLP